MLRHRGVSTVGRARRAGLTFAAVLLALPAAAQVPPSPAEIAAYRGLHAAAQHGDVAAIERLATSKSALAARDDHGRTPLHVATFARQRQAVRALIRAGADTAALDRDRYDAVTIAAVADDEETLRVLLELDGPSAARVLGISQSACSTRLSRALKNLEERIDDGE
jgi:ankyrin repeat protein